MAARTVRGPRDIHAKDPPQWSTSRRSLMPSDNGRTVRADDGPRSASALASRVWHDGRFG